MGDTLRLPQSIRRAKLARPFQVSSFYLLRCPLGRQPANPNGLSVMVVANPKGLSDIITPELDNTTVAPRPSPFLTSMSLQATLPTFRT